MVNAKYVIYTAKIEGKQNKQVVTIYRLNKLSLVSMPSISL